MYGISACISVVSLVFMADLASQTGDADSSWVPCPTDLLMSAMVLCWSCSDSPSNNSSTESVILCKLQLQNCIDNMFLKQQWCTQCIG